MDNDVDKDLYGFPSSRYIRIIQQGRNIKMTRENAHDPRAIANYVLKRRNELGKATTLMQLIKFVYLCDGWSLALLGKPLSKHNAQAWKFGPVYPKVYSAFKQFGSSPIAEPARSKETGLPLSSRFSPEEEEVMDSVVKSYGRLSAWQLSSLTHESGTPWSETFDEHGPYSEIDAKVMAAHFKQLEAERGARAVG